MYDTTNMWLDKTIAGCNHFAIANYLCDVSEIHSNKGYFILGKADNYSVSINEAGISLKGSLAKYSLNDNIQTLTRAGTVEAIEKLSDNLHIPIIDAKVNRIDVSTVFSVSQSPQSYYRYLGNKPYFNRVQSTNNTLYYNTDKKQLVFYDKIKEAKGKGVNIPDLYKDANLLRYELRLTQRICKQLKANEITGATLTDEQFYYNIIQLWGKEYFNINKLKGISDMDLKNIKTPTDAKNILFADLLKDKDISYINSFLNDLKTNKTYSDAKAYTRLKNDLMSLFEAKTEEEQSQLMQELDKEVNNVLRYCR